MPHILSYLILAVFGLLTYGVEPAAAVGTSDEATEAEAGVPAYAEAKASIDAGNYIAALPILLRLTADEPTNADAWNLLGFTQRKLGEFDAAGAAYDTAPVRWNIRASCSCRPARWKRPRPIWRPCAACAAIARNSVICRPL